MTMTELARLNATEELPGRRFTNPEHSHADAAILRYMRRRLLETLCDAQIGASDPRSRELYIQTVPEDGARLHRMVILSRAALLGSVDLALVGFFGNKRGDASPAILQDVDTELLQEFLIHTYVLSYSSLEMPDGNWANMVLLEHTEGIEHWRASQKHAYVARDLAPQFYTSIRLHNGMLPGGLSVGPLMLHTTKYYEYEQAGRWQAIRDFR